MRAILDAHVRRAEQKFDADGVLRELTELAEGLRDGIAHFLTFPNPEETAAMVDHLKETTSDELLAKRRAAYLVNALEGRGFVLDVEKGVRAGHAGLLEEVQLTHDADGMPRVRVRLASRRQVLMDLARIHGLLRDQPPPALPPNVTLINVLHNLPRETLLQLRAALKAEAERQRAIPAEATPLMLPAVGGPDPRWRA